MGSPFAKFSDAQFANYERQANMNPATFGRLTELGLTAETSVRLDFAYDCPNEPAAELLLQYLRGNTNYDISINPESGIEICGTTRLTTITLDILNQWLFWMCQAGVEHGDCVFDGWGTSIPTNDDA